MVIGKNPCAQLLKQGDFDLAAAFRQDYIDLLKQYYYVGRMPEVVQALSDSWDFNMVQEVHQRILPPPMSRISPSMPQ